MTAAIGQLVNVTFMLEKPSVLRAESAACIALDAAVPLVGVGNFPNCPGSSTSTASMVDTSAVVLPRLINLITPTCVDGQYNAVVKMPTAFRTRKCFNIGIQLADGTTPRSIIAITGNRAGATP
jgi:hypothetical protein